MYDNISHLIPQDNIISPHHSCRMTHTDFCIPIQAAPCSASSEKRKRTCESREARAQCSNQFLPASIDRDQKSVQEASAHGYTRHLLHNSQLFLLRAGVCARERTRGLSELVGGTDHDQAARAGRAGPCGAGLGLTVAVSSAPNRQPTRPASLGPFPFQSQVELIASGQPGAERDLILTPLPDWAVRGDAGHGRAVTVGRLHSSIAARPPTG